MSARFDREQCEGGLLKGYSGCMCDYCRSYKQLRGKWTVNVKGAAEEVPFEISIVRANNRHGVASYGWFDDDKLLIAHNGGPCRWPLIPTVWNRMLILAKEVAAELNKKELSL